MAAVIQSREELKSDRHTADPDVDRLVENVLTKEGVFSSVGRLGYNQMLDIADKLLESPELTLVASSTLSEELSKYPERLVKYFDPVKAPLWVDEAKLKRAGELWRQNMLTLISALYCASLPSVYLLKNGIPALYETAKLEDDKYISQRIYETGLFLDAVMSPGGLQIIRDVEEELDEYLVKALKKFDPDGQWSWDGRALRRESGEGPKPDEEKVITEARRLRPTPKRFIWGKGYISAKKVRFLHSSMRFMLTQPDKVKSFAPKMDSLTVSESFSELKTPWDEKTYGKPINQEDLAFTLLTFGYLMPIALSKWGLGWSTKDKEAFLHMWKVVGYLMGVVDDLLTDDLVHAKRIYDRILEQQAGPSDIGKSLTDTLITVLQDYMYSVLGLDKALPPLLIKHQLGRDHFAMISSANTTKSSRGVFPRTVFHGALLLIRIYFFVRRQLFRVTPSFAKFVRNILSNAGDEFIQSWRGVYSRKPFYVPKGPNTWERMQNADDGLVKRVRAWRRKVYHTVVAGIGLLISSTLVGVVGVASVLTGFWDTAIIILAMALGGYGTALLLLTLGLSRVKKQLPKAMKPTMQDA